MSRPHGRVLRVATLALSVLLLASAPAAAQSPAPSLADPADQLALIGRFYTLLALEPGEEKTAGLDAFLGPEFQILRSNGVVLDHDGYAAEPAQIHLWQIESYALTTSADGTVAVVTYWVTTDSTIDGVTQTTTAPRLAVFHWDGSDWTMSSLANFTALPKPGSEPSPAPSPAG